MGDVHDERKANVCRGSSPEIISAYRKRVRDRLHGERLRQRTARGLPSKRPPSISAVTSRADFPTSARRNNEEGTCRDKNYGAGSDVVNSGWVGGDGDGMIQDELGGEPYLMLVRAKNNKRGNQEGEAARGGRGMGVDAANNSVPFCSGCLDGCQGACSPDGERSIPVGADSTGMAVKAEGWGSGRRQGPTLKPSHHEQPKTKGRVLQQEHHQQTISVMLPGGAAEGGGLPAATRNVGKWW